MQLREGFEKSEYISKTCSFCFRNMNAGAAVTYEQSELVMAPNLRLRKRKTATAVFLVILSGMTSTRPVVHFAEPQDNSFSTEISAKHNDQSYTYSSLSCEDCPEEIENWSGLALMTVGVLLFSIATLLFARKYIFKIHEISRN